MLLEADIQIWIVKNATVYFESELKLAKAHLKKNLMTSNKTSLNLTVKGNPGPCHKCMFMNLLLKSS